MDIQSVITYLQNTWFVNISEVEKAKEIIDNYIEREIKQKIEFKIYSTDSQVEKESTASELESFINE